MVCALRCIQVWQYFDSYSYKFSSHIPMHPARWGAAFTVNKMWSASMYLITYQTSIFLCCLNTYKHDCRHLFFWIRACEMKNIWKPLYRHVIYYIDFNFKMVPVQHCTWWGRMDISNELSVSKGKRHHCINNQLFNSILYIQGKYNQNVVV